MSTSGEIGQITLTLQELLDAAFRGCRLTPQQISAEMLLNGRKCLQRMLNTLPSRASPLWARDHKILAFPLNQRAMALPDGTIDIIGKAQCRTYQPFTKTATNNGSNVTYDLAETSLIAVLGFMPVTTGSETIVVSTSNDGTTFTTQWAPGAQSYTAGVMTWFELEPLIAARYVRITGPILAEIDELFVGGSPSDVEITRRSHADYLAIANTTTSGTPREYWLDRKARNPEMRFWPIPDSSTAYSVLSIWRQRHIEDVGTMTQQIEIPARWEEAIISMLAYRIAFDTPQVQIDIVNMLKPKADEALSMIASDERDATPIRFAINLRGYQR
jgi:hypothetical protein